MEIFERTFQSVAGKDKLGKCSFKYFDKHFINFIYGIILKNVPSYIFQGTFYSMIPYVSFINCQENVRSKILKYIL